MLYTNILVLTVLVGVGSDVTVDEEEYNYKYHEEYGVTTVDAKNDDAPGFHTLNDEELSYLEDALKRLLSKRKSEESIPTLVKMLETTTSWYTVKDIVSEILSKLEDEKKKEEEDSFNCSICPNQTLSVFGLNYSQENCFRSDNNACKNIDLRFKKEYNDSKTEENKYNGYETTQNLDSVGLEPVKEVTTRAIDYNTEVIYDNLAMYQSGRKQILDMEDFNKSQSYDFERKLREIAKHEQSESEDNTTLETTIWATDISADWLKSSFNNPVVITGRHRGTKKIKYPTKLSQNASRHRGSKKNKTPAKLRQQKKHGKKRLKTTTKQRRLRTRTSSTTTSTTTALNFDVAKLVELITNLTEDYSQNLTKKIREELEGAGLPDCPPSDVTGVYPSTVDERMDELYKNLTGTIMGKCFVCGLEDTDMPQTADCSDAFAGDFLPLVPVSATAKMHIAKYRKYCRWMNVPKYIINETDPRSMWGRWTGGCSVRWIDISGIYTQRTCRNRHRAIMGLHWASKRMAKLEMALQHVDNGCIISPMASLVPLSRGVSLYARFHACVCTGSWCNQASPSQQCTPYIGIVLAFLVIILRTFLLEYRMRLDEFSPCKSMLFTLY